MATSSVILIEDQFQIRNGLKSLISGTEDFRCSGNFGTMEEALRGIGMEPPDMELVDIGLPGCPGSMPVARPVKIRS